MREILFRGKRIDNGEWVYGDLVHGVKKQKEMAFIWSETEAPPPLDVSEFAVDPSTIGQYTGLKDKNGKYIFEGDIVHYLYEPGKGYWNADQLSVIDFRETGFHMNGIMGTNKYACLHGWFVSIPYDQDAENKPEFEVVGNIHDNPELLKEFNHA